MAKKLPQEDPTELTPGELIKLLDAALEEAGKAAEHTAEHGNIIRQALERYGRDRTAFTIVRRLYKMAPDRRTATVRDMIELSILAGFFDQCDAFDDAAGKLHAKLYPRRKPEKPAELRAVN